MDTQAFQRWLAQVSQLSGKQKSALHQALQEPPTTEVIDGLTAYKAARTAKQRQSILLSRAGRVAYVVIVIVVESVDGHAQRFQAVLLLVCTSTVGVCARQPSDVASARTRPFSGAIASWLVQPSTMLHMWWASLKSMRRSFWSPLIGSASCHEHPVKEAECAQRAAQARIRFR